MKTNKWEEKELTMDKTIEQLCKEADQRTYEGMVFMEAHFAIYVQPLLTPTRS